MNPEKAIKTLTDILKFVKPGDPPEEHDAIKLGIEALKREKRNRDDPDLVLVGLLPGETE